MASLAQWVEKTLGQKPKDEALFQRAVTHSSHSDGEDYERLEYLGDRVLGLAVASWLFELFPHEPEGKLSRRLNALVAGDTCADVGRELGVPEHLRLGKQARDDGASDSDNVVGDVVEALIGALYLERGFEAAAAFVRRAWGERVNTRDQAPKHPKSSLQEWAAAHDRKAPAYQLTARTGPHHAPRFVVEVEIRGVGSASAEGATKQEAETAAAAKLMEQLK
jgi:ribonuclease-3